MTITQAQQKSISQELTDEINQLKTELPKLRQKRQELAQFPPLPENAKPMQVAELIAQSVTQNAGKLRGVEAAISNLGKTLETEQRQHAQAEAREQKAAAWEEIEATKHQMRGHCERINRAAQLIETELKELRRLESASSAARWTAQPVQQSYQFFDCPTEISVPVAQGDDVHFYVEMRPINLSL